MNFDPRYLAHQLKRLNQATEEGQRQNLAFRMMSHLKGQGVFANDRLRLNLFNQGLKFTADELKQMSITIRTLLNNTAGSNSA